MVVGIQVILMQLGTYMTLYFETGFTLEIINSWVKFEQKIFVLNFECVDCRVEVN